jgi:hypothetical protein
MTRELRLYCEQCEKQQFHAIHRLTTFGYSSYKIGVIAYSALFLCFKLPLLGLLLLPFVLLINIFIAIPAWMFCTLFSFIGPRNHKVYQCTICNFIRS